MLGRSTPGNAVGRRCALSLAAAALALTIATHAASAAADDLDDFAYALNAYVNNDFGGAVARFRPLVGSEPIQLRHDLVEAARRYYASSLALTNQEREAVRVLQEMLRDDPDARVDPLQFTAGVVRLFEATRNVMAPELVRIRADRAAQRRARETHLADQRLALQLLETREVHVVRVSRTLTFIPFGVGQYANGSIGLGVFFSAIEALSLAAGFVGPIAFSLVPLPDGTGAVCHISACLPWVITGWAGYGVFALSTVTGVLEANASYRGDHVEVRPRTPPPELRDIHLSFAPTPVGRGALFSVALRF